MNEGNAEPVTPKILQRGISIRDLSVQAGNKSLLVNAEADFKAGQITLIVGPSGVGKSILLKLISGILDRSESAIEHSGDIRINGQPTQPGKVGVVFQSFALFDELSAESNVQLARSFGGEHANKMSANELLDKLSVPKGVPPSRLSGGQKQRLAIARTIGFNPPIMVYDEPTSGLDPATGTQVAQLIQHTHENYGETTLIVTHDYPTLLPIANNIFLLDPIDKCLRKIDSEDWESIPEMLEDMSASFVDESESAELNTVGQNLKNFFERTTDYFFGFWLGVLALIPIWKNPGWGARYLGHYCRLVFGPTALIYLSLAGVISGFVTTFFTFKFLPFSSYTEPLLIEDLLTGLGFAMYRIFVPVLGCVLIAARCGAAITSDIGGRQFGNQIDAMNSYGMKPERYLLTSVIWAFLVGTPILYFASFISARLTSLLTFVSNYPERGPDFWYQNFHRGLVIAGQDWYRGTGWLMAKLLCSGFGVAIISYFIGRSPKFSTSDVSRAITTTILLGTLYVLTVHFIFSLYEYEGIVPGSTVPAPAQ